MNINYDEPKNLTAKYADFFAKNHFFYSLLLRKNYFYICCVILFTRICTIIEI